MHKYKGLDTPNALSPVNGKFPKKSMTQRGVTARFAMILPEAPPLTNMKNRGARCVKTLIAGYVL